MAPEAELLSAPPAPAGVVVVPEAQPPEMGQLASDDGDVLCVLCVVVSPPSDRWAIGAAIIISNLQ